MNARLLVLLLLMGLATALPQGHGISSSPGTYNITLASDHVAVNIQGTLYQNMTTLPSLDFTLSGSNSTSLARDLNSSLGQLDSTVWVRDPVLAVTSNGTLTNYILAFSVFGATHSYLGGSSSADLTWRSFNIQDDIQVNGVYFNYIGKHGLGTSLLSLARDAINPTKSLTVSFQLGTAHTSPLEIQRMAPNLNLLDFSSLSTPFDSWSAEFSVDGLATTWKTSAGFDILATTQLTEPGGNVLTIPERATYVVGATLLAPGFAYRQGNTLYYGSNILDLLFAGLVLVALATLVVSLLIDRGLTRAGSRRFRPKRK